MPVTDMEMEHLIQGIHFYQFLAIKRDIAIRNARRYEHLSRGFLHKSKPRTFP
jgi:hypothetical protein